jgi:hypothetical protein
MRPYKIIKSANPISKRIRLVNKLEHKKIPLCLFKNVHSPKIAYRNPVDV